MTTWGWLEWVIIFTYLILSCRMLAGIEDELKRIANALEKLAEGKEK